MAGGTRERRWVWFIGSRSLSVAACAGDDDARPNDAGPVARDLGPVDAENRWRSEASIFCDTVADCPAADPPCALAQCSNGRCILAPKDDDFDGHGDRDCPVPGPYLIDDCDDNDSHRFPGNPETCDQHDDDCSLFTFGITDEDGDGEVSIACCNLDLGELLCASDCDDSDPAVNSHVVEDGILCNGRDDDCDFAIDEGCPCPEATSRPCGGVTSCGQGTQACAGGSWADCVPADCPDGGMGADSGPPDDAAVDGAIPEDTGPPSDAGTPVDSGPPIDGSPSCVPGLMCTTTLMGPCAEGRTTCDGGTSDCRPLVMPGIETCNAIDDDCNGPVDDGISCGPFLDQDRPSPLPDGYQDHGKADARAPHRGERVPRGLELHRSPTDPITRSMSRYFEPP